MLTMSFTGLIAYPVTPFQQGGRLDLESLERCGHVSPSSVTVAGAIRAVRSWTC